MVFKVSNWRRFKYATGFCAISGMIVGALTVIIWKELQGGIFDIFALLPGFVLSWIAILLFSKYGTTNPNSIAEKYDEVQNRLKYEEK